MLKATLNSKPFYAWRAVKERDYRCPECDKPVILKQGGTRMEHYAHYSRGSCKNVIARWKELW